MIARRSLLRAAAALPIAGAMPPAASALSARDARLVAVAAELQAIEDKLTVLAAAHEQVEDLPEWRALIDRFDPLERELAVLPADTLAGVLAKARGAMVPPVFNCVNGIGDSIVADLVRLQAAGGLVHG